MKVIIAGAGEVGTHLAKLLCDTNHDVTMIDSDIERLNALEAHADLLTMQGEVTCIEDLLSAGVADCDLFIAVPPFESLSILSAILAKKMGAKLTVARINNHQYLLPENREYFKQLGVDEMIYPEQLASEEIVEALKRVGIRQCVEFANGKLMVFAVKLGEKANIIGKTIMEGISDEDRLHLMVVAIIRDGETIIPRGPDRFLLGDRVYFMSLPDGLVRISEKTGKLHYEVNKVMIIGGSRIGEKVATLIQDNYKVKLIEINEERATGLADQLSECLVIHGDGRSVDLLEEEVIQNIDAFVAVTGNSEVNLLACQLAKKFGVKKTVAEIENLDYLDFAETVGIGTVVNKKLLAAASIFRFTLHSKVSNIKWLTNTEAEVIELEASVDSEITKSVVSNLSMPNGVNIGAIIRGERVYIVSGATQIEVGDRVVVFAHHQYISEMEKMFS